MKPLWAALAFLIALSPRAQAQQEPDSDWTLEAPQGDEVDDTASGSEQSLFWDESQRQLLMRFCAQLKVRLKPGGVPLKTGLAAGVLYNRHLRHLPTGKLAVVDQGMLYLPLDQAYTVGTLENGAEFPLGVTALLDGRSTVVRPLDTEMTCRDLRRDPELHDIKTVLPLEGPRMAQMRVGELWQLPLTLKLGGKGGVTIPAGSVQATVSVGYSRKGFASVTLYRLSEDRLRLRLRLDSAEVRDAEGKLILMLPIAQLAAPLAEPIALKLTGKGIDANLLRQVNAFLGPHIDAGYEDVSGHRGLLEYILDPRDPAQLKAAAAALKGDLDSLYKLALQRVDLAALAKKNEGLGKPVFSGTDAYKDAKKRLEFGFPLLFDREGSGRRGQDDMVVQDGQGGRYALSHEGKSWATGFIGTPDMGHLQERHKQRLVQAITYTDALGSTQTPVAVYIQQESFLNHGERRTRKMVAQVNEIMAWAGRDKGPAPLLLQEELLGSVPGGRLDRWGVMSFTLLFNQKAVQDALAASAEAVETAVANIGAKAKTAARLTADLLEARTAATPQAQAAALTEIMAGKGRGRLAYEEVMKVLVQLVDPMDLAAEFFLQVDRFRESTPDVTVRYTFHNGGKDDVILSGIRQLKARFSPPSWLGD